MARIQISDLGGVPALPPVVMAGLSGGFLLPPRSSLSWQKTLGLGRQGYLRWVNPYRRFLPRPPMQLPYGGGHRYY